MNSDIEQLASLAHSQLAHQSAEPAQELSNGTKRKNEDESTSASKTKRSRYISLACNECKRRKIKCNGQTPCQRCGNLNLECIYTPNCCSGFKDSQEFKDMSAHIVSLQEQVNALYDNLNSLRAQLGHHAPVQQPPQPMSQHSQLQALPSIDPSLQLQAYNENPAHSSDHHVHVDSRPRSQQQNPPTFRGLGGVDMSSGTGQGGQHIAGYTQEPDTAHHDDGKGDINPLGERVYRSNIMIPRGQIYDHIHETKDPIWTINQEEALRLCRVYEEATGLMYPVLDVNNMRAHVDKLFPFLVAMKRSGLIQQGMAGADAVEDENTNVLKMVFAIALDAEGGSQSELGKRFFDSIQPSIDTLLLGEVSVNGVRLLIMTAIYELQRGKESTSSRLIGVAARLCVELNLHRRKTYDAIKSELQRAETMLFFWTCYVLDKEWTIGTSIPPALQHADIDSNLPRPGDGVPYLVAMIKYSTIAGKLWQSVSMLSFGPTIGTDDVKELDFLDRQVMEWQRALPQSLQYNPADESRSNADSLSHRAVLQCQVLIHLHVNYLRILTRRPVLLQASSSLSQHAQEVQKVVNIAKDTIRILVNTSRNSDVYRTQQTVYNTFLPSALASLLLAISHSPTSLASDVREDFYLALELVRSLHQGSAVSKKLSRIARSLQDIVPRSRLESNKSSLGSSSSRHELQRSSVSNDADPSRTAAVAMAGLAGHNVDETALFDSDGVPQAWSHKAQVVGNSGKMADDLIEVFEVAFNMPEGDQMPDAASRDAIQGGQQRSGDRSSLAAAIGSDELLNVLKELL